MKRVSFKDGVNLKGLQPEMLHAIDVAAKVWEESNLILTITSAREGQHGAHSHHYKGLAIDVRIHDIAGSVGDYVCRLRDALGPEYQVIGEATHIHIEYDPA